MGKGNIEMFLIDNIMEMDFLINLRRCGEIVEANAFTTRPRSDIFHLLKSTKWVMPLMKVI